jgi:type IV pilus assembly protein PilY1
MQPHRHRFLRIGTWLITLAFFTTDTLAATIDLANSPLANGLGRRVKPNVYFIFDDSSSMPLEYMPDSSNATGSRCYRNFGYNKMYYNPSTTYELPVKADGNPFDGTANAYRPTFTSARRDGYNSSTADDLSATTPVTNAVTVGPVKIPSAAGSNPFATINSTRTITVTHTGNGLPVGPVITVRFTGATGTLNNVNLTNLNNRDLTVTNLGTNSYRVTLPSGVGNNANATGGAGGGSNVFATYSYTVVVGSTPDFYYYAYPTNLTSPPAACQSDGSYELRTATSHQGYDSKLLRVRTVAEEQQNFANWYSFYRNRLNMMKTASGLAFKTLDDKYRVGFSTTSERTGTSATKFLAMGTFSGTQRSNWYNILYDTDGDINGTPLRGALSKAGRYFAGRLSGVVDPVQYSCQQNFAFLTTDGFWNTFEENTGSSGTKYGPYEMDNSTLVGNLDATNLVPQPARPYREPTGRSNTLADVAMYYYQTDLRQAGAYETGGPSEDGSSLNVAANNVPTSSADPASWQHMVTFTLGLGVDDQLIYPTDLPAPGDPTRNNSPIMQGTKNWPDPNVASNNVTVPGRTDDLWHAAENGRGLYLSAKKPSDVVSGLQTALRRIQYTLGSASAAATSNLQPIAGDSTAFIAQYTTGSWVGNLLARSIDPATGVINPDASQQLWSAQTTLDAQVGTVANPKADSDTRTIYTFSSLATDKLKPFLPASLTTEKGNNWFVSNGRLSQSTTWAAEGKTANATQDAMITYLRGRRTYEDPQPSPPDPAPPAAPLVRTGFLFRQREHVLGDIGSAAPVYASKAPFRYSDSGYSAFVASTASRAPTVYVGANDGMLHAFNATNGVERWAYVPAAVMPYLYRLADNGYSLADQHRYYVDGPITVGDAYNTTDSAWKTILVGGLGKGGKSYYALDVTNPASPKALWEFGNTPDTVGDTTFDANLGHSYGNPVITKRASDGRWVVIFASGYNNTPSSPDATGPTGIPNTGDGKARLFVVDAFTGERLSAIAADDVTTNENLSGMARISNYVEDSLVDNITRYVYAGDLAGMLWRFDINSGTSQLLGRTTTAADAGKMPITVQPELAKVRDGNGNVHRVIYFGTGRYLGTSDVSTHPSSGVQQAIFAVKDTDASIGVLTTASTMVTQTLNSGVTPRTSSASEPMNWATKDGWFMTVPTGERFNVDPSLQLGTLVIAANRVATNDDYCAPSGSSILYQLDFKSGNVLMTDIYTSAQIVGTTQLQTQGGAGPVVIDPVFSDGTTGNTQQRNSGSVAGSATRVSWREIE